MSGKLLPGELVLGKLGPENQFIFGTEGEIVARIDEDGTVRLSRYWVDGHISPKTKPLPGSIRIRTWEELPDGTVVVIVNCQDADEFKKLADCIIFSVRGASGIYGKTGWDSDRRVAFYRSDALVAKEVK